MPDFEAIVRRSWHLTKNFKWLWVYGLTLAAFAGGSGSGNFRNIGSIFEGDNNSLPENIDSAQEVLGAATNIFAQWVQNVSPIAWVTVGAAFIVFIIFTMLIGLLATSWAKGGLIYGLNEANNDNKVTLISSTPQGIKHLKSLIILSLISLGVTAVFILILVVLIIILGATWSALDSSIALAIIGVLVFVPVMILSFILLGMVRIYADRLIVLEGYKPWLAWKKGLSLSKSAFLPTAIMGIVNTLISTTVGCLSIIIAGIALGIPSVVLVLPAIKDKSLPSLGILVLLGIAFFIFIYVNILIRGLLVVLRYGNWNLFFAEIYTKSLNKSEENHER